MHAFWVLNLPYFKIRLHLPQALIECLIVGLLASFGCWFGHLSWLYLCLYVCLFKYAEHCNFSSWKGFTPDALLFSVCTALCAPVQRAWHGCWCVIPSDIIALSIHDISNAWITRRSVVSAAHASNEIVLFPLRVSFSIYFIPFAAGYIHIHKNGACLWSIPCGRIKFCCKYNAYCEHVVCKSQSEKECPTIENLCWKSE